MPSRAVGDSTAPTDGRVAERVAAKITALSDASLAMLANSQVASPAVRGLAQAEQRERAGGIDWRPIPGAVNAEPTPSSPTDAQLAAVRLAAELIRADTPGNVVPPRDAVRALWDAGIEWRCRLAAGGKQSRKGDYQWRLSQCPLGPGLRDPWKPLARTPQDGAS